MRRNLTVIIICFITCSTFSQEILNVNGGGFRINFEDTSIYKYVIIDTNNIWYITKPKKQILYSNDYAIISDTNDYYPSNIKASFQFKLCFEYCCDLFYISFSHKYDFEKNKDGGIIETSYDSGFTWQNIIFDTIINRSKWHISGLYNLDDSIESFNNQPGYTGLQSLITYTDIYFWSWGIYETGMDTMLLRFSIASDSIDTNNEGWMLDDFAFYAILVGINENNINNNFLISPNPSNKVITIDSSLESIFKIEVITLSGTKLLEKQNTNLLNITGIKPGIYLIRINDRYIEKLIIE